MSHIKGRSRFPAYGEGVSGTEQPMLRWSAFCSIGVLGFGGLILAGLTRDVRVFVICLPFSLLAVLLWWWRMKDADDARRAHRDTGDDRCN
ncbi:hypothetical protein [Reyranella sp.]|uniref:hypothetical protein n=1 Tax=Reyranella sp. TaxID=1929291 RepID=UPI003F71B8C4